MEFPRESTLTAKLLRLKTQLKQWEREFQKQNGRMPSKLDIQASPSMPSLYREYAGVKLSIQKENGKAKNVANSLHIRGAVEEQNVCGLPAECSEIPKNTAPAISKPENFPTRFQTTPDLPISRSLFFPASCSNSEDSEDGSYISATPPKRTGPKLEQQSTPMSSYRPVRRPLQEISAGQLNRPSPAPNSSKLLDDHQSTNTFKRKAPEIDDPKKLSTTPALSSSENILPRPEVSPELGFVIKRRRPGLHFTEHKSYPKHDVLPAGFSASILGSNFSWKDCKRPSVRIQESLSLDADQKISNVTGVENSISLAPSLHSQDKDRAIKDVNILPNEEPVGPSESHPSPTRQVVFTSTAEQLSSRLQAEIIFPENFKVPAHSEVEIPTTQRVIGGL
ncbi:hypothetical protein R1flu_003717 [Riccia fluitans]|uniref:DNA replication regulator SLD2 n=1 Tax=Riccia fluitans TaxID=41844 RepID=A0ABD1YCU8_9MARC